ncbi:radical SAM protein [Methanococcus voltae]|uniref:MoaA/NifB/PqqE/SkfB family radical SAM enzyme n=1 Tax=Methanococcus voltae TaxID=2188 RepID=A0A8J7RZK5_METVO|nr:radical SAM protein [Methanococcus voltae]MBP2172324.1 MoaA/NifB/PqqE/SkfB family radical SAM enzyme [Methanococcus voltae]MBP2200720.1 MoaA/NifB/PqqE/SkfB family radical SAM enzyme [Methanococcus voltae]
MKIVLRNDICEKLENIVKDLRVTNHCIGCEGLDLNNKDPHHHPSIEITQKCNHNCIFCYSKLTEVKAGLYGDIEENKAVTISQYGEPLTYPEKVKKAVKYVKSHGKRCDLQTNGSLLNENLINELKELGLDMVMISLSSDSKNPEKHFKLSNNDNYDKIFENIKLCAKNFHTIVRSIYIPNYNEQELINLAKEMEKIGVHEIMLHQLIVHDSNASELKEITNIDDIGYVKDLLILVDKMKKEAPTVNVTIKGCLLVYLKDMDGFVLNNIKTDCISEVPSIKREYIELNL